MARTEWQLPEQMTALVLKDENLAAGDSATPYYAVRLETVSVPPLDPQKDDVLVRLEAVALNHRDVWIRKALYPGLAFGSIQGSDGVGTVVAASRDEGADLLGETVVLLPGYGWEADPRAPESSKYSIMGLLPLPGTFAEYVVVPRAQVFTPPKHLTRLEAAALPLGGLTAFRATFTKAELRAGENVLVTGIGGGVALLALQFAVAAGANVYVTSSSPEKLARAMSLGAKGGVNYKDESWAKQLRKLLPTDRPYLDSVIDSSGGDIMTQVTSLMRMGGIVACFGMHSTPRVTFPMSAVLKHIELRGSTMGSRAEFQHMLEFVDQHSIRPVIGGTWKGLENIEKMYEAMRSATTFGKLVLELTDTPSNKL